MASHLHSTEASALKHEGGHLQRDVHIEQVAITPSLKAACPSDAVPAWSMFNVQLRKRYTIVPARRRQLFPFRFSTCRDRTLRVRRRPRRQGYIR